MHFASLDVMLRKTLGGVAVVLALMTTTAAAEPAGPSSTGAQITNLAKTCDGIELRVVTEATDPAASLVTLVTASDRTPRLRRAGDAVGGAQIELIGYNARRLSPAAWFSNGGTVCQALLFEPPARAALPPPSPETSRRLPRRAKLRVVPELENGAVVGVRLLGIQEGGLLAALGFENGDRLEAVNGFDVTTPEKALQAYARLRTASHIRVKLLRSGRSMEIDYYVR